MDTYNFHYEVREKLHQQEFSSVPDITHKFPSNKAKKFPDEDHVFAALENLVSKGIAESRMIPHSGMQKEYRYKELPQGVKILPDNTAKLFA